MKRLWLVGLIMALVVSGIGMAYGAQTGPCWTQDEFINQGPSGEALMFGDVDLIASVNIVDRSAPDIVAEASDNQNIMRTKTGGSIINPPTRLIHSRTA